ncbi:RNA polymerase sigma factor [Dictyobacter formicarum]|uniref:DNA-directed RNA polymerase sigma-70 factor n=1 Tax=Dictyobacter formicarum TaxID=2778368 RepID=A0ABQ3VHN9_9CHLR|nr:sigma-70 family RNA polymerase sigma factor [Dictyobacter formicarum]GHO85570.1 DNA-directed RNA polymerase sigma-70 factor [Dictyobacter formicarum]
MMHQTRHTASLKQSDEPEESHPSSVALLYQRYAANILMYIRSRVATKEDAEDILLEVFMAALQNKTPLHLGENEQLTWLRHVARNKIVDRYRQQRRRPTMASLEDVAETLFACDEEAPEALALRNADYDELLIHLADLSQIQQEILHLRFARELSTKEIAQQLQKSDGAIRTMLSRTLNHLRDIYEQYRGGK